MCGQFEACAIFPGEDRDCVEALRIPLSKELQLMVVKTLESQIKIFEELAPVDYDGRYKADEDERLTIHDYKDPGNVIGAFSSYLEGKSSDILRSVDDLQRCRALLFHLPTHPGKILIQRFSRSLIASRDKYFGIFDKDSFSMAKESTVSVANSLTAIYEITTRDLHFKNIQTIRSAIPGFVDVYAPGADANMTSNFFSNPIFDKKSAEELAKKDSQTIGRLIWLIHESKVKVESKFKELQQIDKLLNMHCIQDNVIKLPSEVQRSKIILSFLIGDVFVQDSKVYLTNSKRALTPFS